MGVSRVDGEAGAASVEQFVAEISKLSGIPLRSKARAFNTQRFVDSLKGDGFSMLDIKRIFLTFARQFAKTGQRAPETGAYNLYQMALLDPESRRHLKV